LVLSVLSGDALDTLAEVLSWAVLVIVPIVGIAVFWILHIMPEKIAEKRHHPQAKAIQTLCLLSLFFGGLFWPLAWLWAYSKPVLHKMAYGTDIEKHGHGATDEVAASDAAPVIADDLRQVRERLDALAHKAPENEELRDTIRQVAVLEARFAAEQSATGGQA
jgi:CBS domain containing-hemolysin-like protein